jgi:hypothetical protein
MAEFLQWTERETNAGPGRPAITATANAVSGDPTNMAAVMSNTTYDFAVPYEDLGSPTAEVTVTRTFEETAYRVALSNGDFGASPGGFTMAVEFALAQIADPEMFKLAWFIDAAVTQVTTTNELILGLSAPLAYVYRSIVLVTRDWKDATKLRAFYLRKVGNVAGDSAHVLGPAALQELPLRLRAYGDSSAANGRFFGFIMQHNGFGGHTVP